MAIDDAYLLAYEEARRALDEQERSVVELRARAGQLIAGAAITTSFFGGQALRHHIHRSAGSRSRVSSRSASPSWSSFGRGATGNLCSRQHSFIETYVEPPEEKPLELPAIHRDLALHMGHSADLNRRQFRWLTAAFRLGAILLENCQLRQVRAARAGRVAEVVAWVVALVNQSYNS